MNQQPPRNTQAVAAVLNSEFVIMTGYGILLPILPFFVERLALRSGIDQKTVNFHVGALTSIYFYSSYYLPSCGANYQTGSVGALL